MKALNLEEFIDSRSLEKLTELHEILTEERLSVADTGVNYRVINHWDEKGIIRFARNKKVGNRKFSFVDFVWIKIVNELRSFGVQLPVIEKIASDLYRNLPLMELFDILAKDVSVLDKYKESKEDGFLNFITTKEYKSIDMDTIDFKVNFLQTFIIEAIATRTSVSIIVFNDGEWFPFIKASEDKYNKEFLYKKENTSQVRVNITNIIFKYILDDFFNDYFNELNLFTAKEIRLLNVLKEGKYRKVKALFKNKKIETIEWIKSKSTPHEVLKIIREKSYREFIITDKKNQAIRINNK